MRKKVINHEILIALIDINPFFSHFTLVTTFVTVVVVISNSKFGCFLSFSCNFPAKTFANVLFFVRVAYFAGTTNPTSRFLFPITIALSLFSGDASKKYVSGHEISIGICPTKVSGSSDLKAPMALLLFYFF